MSANLFRELHYQEEPLLLGNVWDAQSARMAQDSGFKALGSASKAISHILGREDGEGMSFEELYFMVSHIKEAVSIPFSVDMEAGYSRNQDTINTHIGKLVQLGVAGINLEDSVTVQGKRSLTDATEFTAKIAGIKEFLSKNNADLFINARTDGFLVNAGIDETLKRMAAYENAGADGLFVPGLKTEADIKKIVAATRLPVNIYVTEGIPNF